MVTAQEQQKRGRFDLRLPVAEREALRLVAQAEGRTSTDVVRELIAQAARRHTAVARRISTGDDPPDEAALT